MKKTREEVRTAFREMMRKKHETAFREMMRKKHERIQKSRENLEMMYQQGLFNY